MIRDTYSSLKDNLKERTTNPFLGTFTMVLLIHHWKILYALFNFDSNLSLQDRLDYITNYIKSSSLWEGVVVPVFVALLIIILTYLLINTSRLITNFYEKKVTPWVYKITDSSSVVLKSDYDKLVQKTYQLEEKVNAERAKRLEVEAERDKLESRGLQRVVEVEDDNEKLNPENNTAVTKIANRIISGYLTAFQKLMVDINHNNPISDGQLTRYLVSAGVITLRFTDPKRGNVYDLTPFGEEVRKEVYRIN